MPALAESIYFDVKIGINDRLYPFRPQQATPVTIFNQIRLNNVRGDLFGGLTTAIVALPMALTFGVASGAGPQAGLYGAIFVGLFASLFGGTPTLISEPTGPMTVVMTAVIANLTAANPENGLAMAFTVVMLAGVFQIIFGMLRLGKYVTLMPYTVISGFMTGIGVILIILQLAPFLGQATPQGGVVGTLQNIPNLIADINPPETVLAITVVAILFLIPDRWKRYAPPQLVALTVGTAVSFIFFSGIDIRRVGDIGEIPIGVLPSLSIPTFSADQIQLMFVDALVLAMLGCIDALLTSMIADSLTRTQHDSDRELIGQGLGNLASGFFGGIAGAGATMGTVANIQVGARSALSGLARAGILFAIVLVAGPVATGIPLAVLAGIALKVGLDIVDWNFLKRAHQVSIKGALITYGVILLTVFVDLIVAVGLGVFVANILTIKRLTDLQSESVRAITDDDDQILLSDREQELLQAAKGRVLLFHLSGPMIFGVAKAISRQHSALEEHDILIIDLGDVALLGVTASLALENAIIDAQDEGRHVLLVGAKGKIEQRLRKFNILDRVAPQHRFPDRAEALECALAILKARRERSEEIPDEPAFNVSPLPESAS